MPHLLPASSWRRIEESAAISVQIPDICERGGSTGSLKTAVDPGQRTDSEGRQELVLIQHHGQDPAQLFGGQEGEHALSFTARIKETENPVGEFRAVLEEPVHAPPEAGEEAIAHFETAALGAILHISPDAGAARRLKSVQARCLSIDFAGVAHETTREWLDAVALIGEARDACPQVMLLNLRPDRGLAAQAAGATHAVFADMKVITV